MNKYKNPDANLSGKIPAASDAHRMAHHINRTAENPTPRESAPAKMVEKYLYASDFLDYILDN